MLVSVVLSLAACGDPPVGPDGPIPGPELLTPAQGDSIEGKDVLFTWEAVEEASGYELQIASDSGMTDPLVVECVNPGITVQPGLTATYWWRARASVPEGYSEWSAVWSFFLLNPCMID
jgi:hypothetical protein